jgi:hypothetical protein
MVLSQTQIGIYGAIRGFPANKGPSRMVDGVKQYTLYTEDDLELVGCYDEQNNLVFKIVRLPKRDVLDTYTFAVKTGTSISQSEVDGIYNDFTTQLQKVESEEQEEDSQKTMQVIPIQEEVVRGQELSITHYIDAYIPTTQSYRSFYEVKVPSQFGGGMQFNTLTEAQDRFESVKTRIMNQRTSSSNSYEYASATITFHSTSYLDGESDSNQTWWSIEGLPSQFKSQFYDGDIVEFDASNYDYSMDDITFGTISLDEENDLIILKEYVEMVLNPPEIVTPPLVVPNGPLPIGSWGWYRDNSPDNPSSPFSTCSLVEVYTVEQTDGRIMGIVDSDIWGIPSGAVKLLIKEGYSIRLRLMTQESGYWESHIPNITTDTKTYRTRGWREIAAGEIFNQDTNYIDTDMIEVVMVGGDSLEIDIDSEVDGIGRFSLISNGKQIVKGGPRSIDNETFLEIISVTKNVQGDPDDGGSSGSNDSSADVSEMSWVPVIVAGVLIVGILYLVFSDGVGE